jgi:hypothetical protein
MAHMIDTTTGNAAIAYSGLAPWHKLGQQLTAGATIQEWRPSAPDARSPDRGFWPKARAPRAVVFVLWALAHGPRAVRPAGFFALLPVLFFDFFP